MSSSNSLRISQDLFQAARACGDKMSRSAAQQVEHWARLGAALERAGLTLADAMALLGDLEEARADVETVSERELWRRKREAQARDIATVASGEATWGEMSWFSREVAKSARMLNGPY